LKEPQLARIHQEKLERSKAIIVHLDSTVIDFDIDEVGRVTPIIAGRNGPIRVAARYVALAAGGLESTRLLLAVRARRPHLFGGLEGPLGRFYMGHLSGKIASLVLTHPTDAANFDFEVDCEGNFVRRRFVINDDVQLAEKLMNVAFWLDNPPLNDPRHGSGTLSAVFVALAIPPLGRRLTPEKIRFDHVGSGPHNYAGHGRNIVFDAPRSVANIVALLHNRFVKRMPGFLIRNSKGRYALHYHAEHGPNPDSRVTLSDERDAFGLRRLRIDFRVADRDALSVVRAHRVLEQSLSASDQGMLDYWYPRERLLNEVMRQARSGGTHQLGTTRMGTDSATSVVDSNLKVHSLANLYVASSSTLPTPSQASPTLLAAALALRLAHHLKRMCQAGPAPPPR
jgi:choline dehydrogenase-like flavoprotein